MTETTDIDSAASRPRRMAREPKAETSTDVAIADAHAADRPNAATAKQPTKAVQVEALLSREGGASLGDLCKTTGWLPHTARAFLTGLRKKGRAIERIKLDGETRYTIALAIAP